MVLQMISFRCPEDLAPKLDVDHRSELIIEGLRAYLTDPAFALDIPTHNKRVKQIILEVSKLLVGGESKRAAQLLANNLDQLLIKEHIERKDLHEMIYTLIKENPKIPMRRIRCIIGDHSNRVNNMIKTVRSELGIQWYDIEKESQATES